MMSDDWMPCHIAVKLHSFFIKQTNRAVKDTADKKIVLNFK